MSSVKRSTDDNIPFSHFKLTDLAVSLSGPSGTTTLSHLTIHFKLTDLAVSLSGPSDHFIQLLIQQVLYALSIMSKVSSFD